MPETEQTIAISTMVLQHKERDCAENLHLLPHREPYVLSIRLCTWCRLISKSKDSQHALQNFRWESMFQPTSYNDSHVSPNISITSVVVAEVFRESVINKNDPYTSATCAAHSQCSTPSTSESLPSHRQVTDCNATFRQGSRHLSELCQRSWIC